ncbi:hypothetical protein EGW08_010592 [Elysia chlorotica]|uniref:Uncharacterized protein n=1 Tax=Elysia chlorotica TaxID=188477 RepID=A0A433TJ76_ELYCH|nr:hypothetical protein EGW08_010592 [Elysia chlorotica]
MQNRSILSSNMTPDQTIRLQDMMGSCAYQISSCLEESPQQRFAYESVKASATFKKGMTQERKSTIVLKNSSSRKEALQATYKKHLYSNLLRDSSVRKQKSIVSCPYNLRYRLLNS